MTAERKPSDESALSTTRVNLYTDSTGLARFRDDPVDLPHGTPAIRLSDPSPSRAVQFRVSPVGYESQFHCSDSPAFVVVLGGTIEVELRDGTTRAFGPGEFFVADDRVPDGESFDDTRHGHRSRQVGDENLVTLFVWL